MLRKTTRGIGVIVAALVVLTAVPALAGPNKASITADELNPHGEFGQQVYFTVSADRVERPWINARCYQDGEVVYAQWHGAFDSYRFDPVFTLGPTPSWQSGDAECVAEVGVKNKNGKFRVLASYEFVVLDKPAEPVSEAMDAGSAETSDSDPGDITGAVGELSTPTDDPATDSSVAYSGSLTVFAI